MFIFKKVVSQFLAPVPLCLFISFAGLFFLWFTKKQKTGRVLVSAGICLLALLSFDPVSEKLIGPLEHRYGMYVSEDMNDRAEFVVVLGGGHVSDPSIPVTGQINDSSLVRIVEGVRVYRSNPGSKLVLSGGSVSDPVTEASVAADIAKITGVDEADIIMESDSLDTKDQARLIKPIVGDSRFVLVTSAYHMPRSMAMFRKAGMNPVPAPTGHLARKKRRLTIGSFFPDALSLERSEAALHEYLGIVWAKLRGQI
jgi:uncharacterized SAM-binding protein YcdF (DUF218 family)